MIYSENKNPELQMYYQEILYDIIPQMARILADGYSLDVSKSRGGLKIFRTHRVHETLERESKKVRNVQYD